MRNGTISETKEQVEEEKKKPEHSVQVSGCGCMIFGIIASINLVFCTPIYLGVIGWLAGKVMGDG